MLPTKTSTWNLLLHPSLTSAERGSQEERQRDHVHAEALLSATHSPRFLSADFCSPFSGSAQKNGTSLVNHWPGKDGKKEQEVKNSPARTIRKYTVAPRTPWGGVVGSVWRLFFPPLRLQTSCNFLFVLPQRLEAAVKLRPLRHANPPPRPRLPTPPRWSSSGRRDPKTSLGRKPNSCALWL